jgi:hypothetical protein
MRLLKTRTKSLNLGSQILEEDEVEIWVDKVTDSP